MDGLDLAKDGALAVAPPHLPSVVVLKPLNVILSEVSAALDLDEDQFFGADVFDTMCSARRHVDRATGLGHNFASIQRHFCGARDYHPVLGSMRMPLIA